MNAPKLVMFLTVPSRTCPFSRLLIMEFLWPSRSFSSRTLWETITFVLAWLIFSIATSRVCPTQASKSRIGFTSICDPGRKASMPAKSTTKPPLVLLFITAVSVPWLSAASCIASQALMSLACLRDKISWPATLSCSFTYTSTSSPGLSSGISRNSECATSPSDLPPILIMTFWSKIPTTRPLTIWCSWIAGNVSS